MPKSLLHPTTTPLLIILGTITAFYHLVITPENPPALLFYYVILIIIGYSQGKTFASSRQNDTTAKPSGYWVFSLP